jgi:hypothetical protein
MDFNSKRQMMSGRFASAVGSTCHLVWIRKARAGARPVTSDPYYDEVFYQDFWTDHYQVQRVTLGYYPAIDDFFVFVHHVSFVTPLSPRRPAYIQESSLMDQCLQNTSQLFPIAYLAGANSTFRRP